MSDFPLPDDLADWPTDPFELLGINRRTSKVELRKAYVRLIRAYKPEFHPQEFQRIRQAYDSATSYLSWQWIDYQTESDHAAEESGDADSPASSSEYQSIFHRGAEDAQPDAGANPSADDPLAGKRPAQRRDPFHDSLPQALEQAWRDALAGQARDAYARLVALAEEQGAREEICLRLYWLLTLSPELDQAESVSWLEAGLKQNGHATRMRELYRRHLEHDPAAALTEGMTGVLAAAPNGQELAQLLAWRWEAASLLRRHDLMFRDLQQYRSQVLRDDEGSWLHLVINALDRLCWDDDPAADEAFQYCVREAEALEHLHVHYDNALIQLDLLVDARRDRQRLQLAVDIPIHWLTLLPLSAMTSLEHGRNDLMLWCEAIAKDPRNALRMFDRLVHHSPTVTVRLGDLIQRYSSEQIVYEHDRREEELIVWQVRRLINGFENHASYGKLRQPLLQFCVRESISPRLVAEALPLAFPQQSLQTAQLSGQLIDDGALLYVYLACRTVRG